MSHTSPTIQEGGAQAPALVMRYPDPWPDFLAKCAAFQTLTAKNAYSFRKKHKWRGKRTLVPGAKPKRSRGGQPGNRNAFKHGAFGGEQLVTWAMFTAFLRATETAKRRPRSAPRERL